METLAKIGRMILAVILGLGAIPVAIIAIIGLIGLGAIVIAAPGIIAGIAVVVFVVVGPILLIYKMLNR